MGEGREGGVGGVGVGCDRDRIFCSLKYSKHLIVNLVSFSIISYFIGFFAEFMDKCGWNEFGEGERASRTASSCGLRRSGKWQSLWIFKL